MIRELIAQLWPPVEVLLDRRVEAPTAPVTIAAEEFPEESPTIVAPSTAPSARRPRELPAIERPRRRSETADERTLVFRVTR